MPKASRTVESPNGHPDHPDHRRSRRRPRRPDPARAKGKGRAHPNGVVFEQGPLTEWPPSGMSSQEELTLGHAMELVSRGVPAHKGHKRPVPHASDHYYALYTTSAGNQTEESDVANLHDSMTQLMTLRMQGGGAAIYPWETLEQPSFAFFYGQQPGTITLNQWASLSSIMPPTIALRDSGVTAREVDLARIFERLKELESGLEDDDEEWMYKSLYRRFLRDPDKVMNPHKGLEKQITDLIMVLSRPDWIDFTNPKNQVVTRFIFDPGHGSQQQYIKFCHQLVLSMELDLRINSRLHGEWAKEKLLPQLPPTIQWDLALARRWREHVRVEGYGKTVEQINLRFRLKKRQIKMLRRFAQMMKWPNLGQTLDKMKQRDMEATLDIISSDALAFFSGLVLPGSTFPFLIMNTLIDIDPDKATDSLAMMTHLHPHCGFQYRNSYTYWTAASIVGKVLAPTCRSLAGWVGPARPTTDLGRSQIARVRSRRPRQRMTPEDVQSMSERSDPLGPPAEVFPVKEYKLIAPDADDIVDTVRIELLSFKTVPDRFQEPPPVPKVFDATVQFAVDGVSWPMRLTYDVSFISAWPCSDGPHPLFFDYVFQTVKADEIMNIKDWGGLYGQSPSARTSRTSSNAGPHTASSQEQIDEEQVLVVEAFGVRDNEVLARAWCSHWGLSAVVADIRHTCMACAIREAYAATLTVVILVDDQEYNTDD
ncbi:TPR domain containing protein [Colletotrichum tofieldiae]|nr:TPR domain containing protein [Colletotrichum tofieldiae]GKT79089.1 TPR domain containing protein [Colletotrichum tofieldiae]